MTVCRPSWRCWPSLPVVYPQVANLPGGYAAINHAVQRRLGSQYEPLRSNARESNTYWCTCLSGPLVARGGADPPGWFGPTDPAPAPAPYRASRLWQRGALLGSGIE